ncbi:MAG TPA: sigma factor-like helix-turn-helix DNA-binding protein [bacterium]|nr:sigma factor-like helix-turn-helix DNA-binding protein [bacterium]
MSNDKQSILDQIISSERDSAILEFDPKEVVSELLKVLNDREKEIITKRYSLRGDKKFTLDSIGKTYNITRERIRQIENIAIKKMKNISDKIEAIKKLDSIVNDILSEYLGILSQDNLIQKILRNSASDNANYQSTRFLINKILSDNYDIHKEDDNYYELLRSKNSDFDEFNDAIVKIVELFSKKQEPIHKSSLWQTYADEKDINFNSDKINEDILLEFLNASKKIKQNPLGELGLTDWKSIIPKRMSDKIFLVMKNYNKPMHFREIADEINKMGFDKKSAHPATVHNELILDDKYVLVGRGIYALKKWGYESGKVSEIVEKILQENGPMKKDDLINQVLKKKLVKKTTVNLAIINNKNIKKNSEGKYYLETK